MTSASKRKGYVSDGECAKHCRPERRKHLNKIVRRDGKDQCMKTSPVFNDGDWLESGELMTIAEHEVLNLGSCFCWPYNDPESCDCESRLNEEVKNNA